MVNLTRMTIELGDKTEKIDRLEVWFLGPTGLIPKQPLALEVFQTYVRVHDDEKIEFHNMFKLVPVAVAASGMYEMIFS